MTWLSARLDRLSCAADGVTYDADYIEVKLAKSVSLHGQLRPIVARRVGDLWQIIDGRKLYRAMVSIGSESCLVADVGQVSDHDVARISFGLETLKSDTNYAKIASVVAGLIAGGETPESLSSTSKFSSERIGYFERLSRFDWTSLDSMTDQSEFSWDEGSANCLPSVSVEPIDLARGVVTRSLFDDD